MFWMPVEKSTQKKNKTNVRKQNKIKNFHTTRLTAKSRMYTL